MGLNQQLQTMSTTTETPLQPAASLSGQVYQIKIPAPTRTTFAVLGEEPYSDPFFGTLLRKRLYNIRHLYDPAFPAAFTIGEAPNLEPSTLRHPLEMVVLDGPRPDPRFCLQRLRAFWLLGENRGGQLDNDPVLPLRHQAALIDFLTRGDSPRRVLIADEVGLGKTVEAGLHIRHLLGRNPQLRVLYVTLGGLVENVLNEFDRLDLPRWYYFGNISTAAAARLDAIPIDAMTADTRLVVASIHKLCAANRFEEQRRYLGDARFDLVIVDECHTLRAYGPAADSPQVWFRAVRSLLEHHLVADGRVLFMSATPHQGHREVFLNLTALCTGTPLGESEIAKAAAARGRVIFRVKEHIRDWEGRRIFPVRDVRLPHLVQPPANYREVLDAIAEHFDWIRSNTEGAQAQAVGFVKSQALQYAASSLRAGFAYLLRRLIRYYPHTSHNLEIQGWAKRLIPYRGRVHDGKQLIALWQAEQHSSVDEGEAELLGVLHEDYEDLADMPGEEGRLVRLLRSYDALFDDPNADTKTQQLREILGEASEPIVVFSQAVDTVYELEARLAAMGVEVYRLTGDMGVDARADAVHRFRTSRNPSRALISSAAGGVGINLQVARWVVHFDLPWNPMTLEQRVGRVHRIGSTKTILVDTILLAGSREADVFARISSRLETIVADLSADPTERESLFRRILASLDPDRLREIFAGERGLDDVGAAVDEGRRAVEDADREMGSMAAVTREQRGRAETRHLIAFLQAADVPFHAVRREVFATVIEGDDGELQSLEQAADLYSLDGWDEPIVFDRVAASYLNMRRDQTGGVGHPAIDSLIRTAVDVQPDMEKARASTWLARKESFPEELKPGSIAYLEAVGEFAEGSPTTFRLAGRVWYDGNVSDLSGTAIEALLWDDGWVATRKAGELPDVGQLSDCLAAATVSSDSSRVTVRWPLAAIGIRDLPN